MNHQDMINELKTIKDRSRNDAYVIAGIIRQLEKEVKETEKADQMLDKEVSQ